MRHERRDLRVPAGQINAQGVNEEDGATFPFDAASGLSVGTPNM
jgi:hypothetical protein